jgi:hypothetical protein
MRSSGPWLHQNGVATHRILPRISDSSRDRSGRPKGQISSEPNAAGPRNSAPGPRKKRTARDRKNLRLGSRQRHWWCSRHFGLRYRIPQSTGAGGRGLVENGGRGDTSNGPIPPLEATSGASIPPWSLTHRLSSTPALVTPLGRIGFLRPITVGSLAGPAPTRSSLPTSLIPSAISVRYRRLEATRLQCHCGRTRRRIGYIWLARFKEEGWEE